MVAWTPRPDRTMRCSLCHERIDLWDLDDEGWSGEPVHTWCGEAARQAWRDALDYAKTEREKRVRNRAA